MAKLFDGRASVKCSWAVNLQSVREEINLYRRSFGVHTIIPMDQGIQDGLPQSVDGIFGSVGTYSALWINYGTDFHVSFRKSKCFDQPLNRQVVLTKTNNYSVKNNYSKNNLLHLTKQDRLT